MGLPEVVSAVKAGDGCLSVKSEAVLFGHRTNRMETGKWLVLAVGAFFLFGPFTAGMPVAGLERREHWVLAVILLTLAAWILHPVRLPRGVAGVLMTGLLLAGGLPYGDVFYGFTTSAVWIIIPAFLFGFVISRTGLGSYITVRMLKRFQKDIVGTAGALMVIGIVFSVLTPSTTVRIAIVMPIVLSVVKTLRLKSCSREAAFVTLAAYTAILIPGNGWQTGSLVGPFSLGLLPPLLQAELDWVSYSRALIFPWMLISVLLFGYLFLVFRPHQCSLPETGPELEAELQPISKEQKTTAVILSLCFLGYLTTPLHGLESAAITAFAVFLLFFSGILNAADLSAGVNWEMVLFFGTIMTVTRVFTETGISAVLTEHLSPLVALFSGNVTLFIYVALGAAFIVRFVDVAWGIPTIAVLFSFAPALYAAGIHPVVLCFLNGAIQYFTFVHYMSPFALMADNLLEHQGWGERHLILFGTGYLLSVAVSVIPTVWYWRLLGLL